jgi:hypothetical protein
VSVFGPVTDADRRHWQRRGAVTLVDLLASAASSELPPLHWQLGPTSMLVGQCLDPDMAQRKAAFEAWAAFLSPGGRRSETFANGTTYLRVECRDWNGHQGTDVVVLAQIHAPEPTDGAA